MHAIQTGIPADLETLVTEADYDQHDIFLVNDQSPRQSRVADSMLNLNLQRKIT